MGHLMQTKISLSDDDPCDMKAQTRLPLPVHTQNGSAVHSTHSAGWGFKAYVIASMTVVWTMYTVMIRYTRVFLQSGPMYFSTTVVVLSELTKLLLATLLLIKSHSYNLKQAKAEFIADFVNKPKDLLRMSVPALVYALQNNLDFVALSNLDAGVYQVTTQLKVVTTALFMMCMLGRRFSSTRWSAIVLLFVGVALVQWDGSRQKAPQKASGDQNYVVGIAAVLTTCLTAGFAGVYFEKMLKDAKTSLWIRNMQMYASGVVVSVCGCIITDGSNIMEKGFFYGYHSLVLVIVALLSVGGIYISMVMKYLDNMLKSFASAISISLVSLVSFYLLGSTVGIYFVIGTVIVCSAIMLYNYVNE